MGSIDNLSQSELQVVRHFLKRVADHLGGDYRYSLLFGSKARGDFHAQSDIDIAVIVGSLDFRKKCEILDLASDEMLETDIEISPLVFSEDDFRRKQLVRSPIFREIERDMVQL